MNLLTRIETAQDLWKFTLPTVALPPRETWVRWLTASTDKDFEKVIALIPARRRQGDLASSESVHRFVSAVLSRFRQAKRMEEHATE